MGRKLTRVPQWPDVCMRRDGRRPGRRVREVPVPGALAAPQDAPRPRHRITADNASPATGTERR